MKLTKKQRETIEMLTKVRGPIVDMYKLKVRTNNKSANRSNKINTVTVVFESTIYEVTSGGRIE